MGRWMFSALPFAGSAAILLFSIRGSTIADDIFASAVRALHGDRDHQTFYFFQDFCFYSITAFSFCPLPKRERTEIRLDSGWGSEPSITWLLQRGYQVTGKFRSAGRVRKLVRGISTWHLTSSPGREVAEVPAPVVFVRPLRQYAVCTPSKEYKSGYYHAVVFTSRTDLSLTGVVEHYDGRAGIEADLKSDKHGLGLAIIRKRLLPAQKLVVLLVELAHNILIWARSWLGEHAPRLREYGIVRLIGQVWAVPGRVKLTDQEGVIRVR